MSAPVRFLFVAVAGWALFRGSDPGRFAGRRGILRGRGGGGAAPPIVPTEFPPIAPVEQQQQMPAEYAAAGYPAYPGYPPRPIRATIRRRSHATFRCPSITIPPPRRRGR